MRLAERQKKQALAESIQSQAHALRSGKPFRKRPLLPDASIKPP